MTEFDWDEFLNLAKRLLGNQQGEAELRTSISRAYYSAFHKSERFCEMFNIQIPDSIPRQGERERSRHQRLIAALRQHQSPIISQAGRLLDGLRNRRTKADYESEDLSKTIKKQAEIAVSEAESINSNLYSYRP